MVESALLHYSEDMMMSSLHLGKLEVSSGFLLLAALFIYQDDQGLALPMLGACLMHEIGHWVAIRALGGKIKRVHIGILGAEIVLDRSFGLSYGKELLCTLAGPGMNFVWATVSAKWNVSLWTGLNLIIGCFQMLPVVPLDGGRGLFCLLCLIFRPEQAELWARWIGIAVSAILLTAGMIILMITRGNFTLLALSIWIFTAFGRRKDLSTPV